MVFFSFKNHEVACSSVCPGAFEICMAHIRAFVDASVNFLPPAFSL